MQEVSCLPVKGLRSEEMGGQERQSAQDQLHRCGCRALKS